MACKAQNIPVAVKCSTPREITLFDPDACPEGTTVSIINQPCRTGATLQINGNKVTYTPCENFLGVDNFSYSLDGTDEDPGIGVVTLTVTGDNCHYLEVTRCKEQPLGRRTWIHQDALGGVTASQIAQAGNVFKADGACFAIVNACTTCPLEPPLGETIAPSSITWVPQGCCDPECAPTCCACGNCCFSSDSSVTVKLTLEHSDDSSCNCILAAVASATAEHPIVLPFRSCGEWSNSVSGIPECTLAIGTCDLFGNPTTAYLTLWISWDCTNNHWGAIFTIDEHSSPSCSGFAPTYCWIDPGVWTYARTGDCRGGMVIITPTGPTISPITQIKFDISVNNNPCCKCGDGDCHPMANAANSPRDGNCLDTPAQDDCCADPP